MDNPDDPPLLAIHLDDDEPDPVARRAERTAQSDAQFEAVRAQYRVKVEDGEIHKTLNLPLVPGATPKMALQQLLHAVEELYFFRRYRHALDLIHSLHRDGSHHALDQDTRNLIHAYEARCRSRLNQST